jgi:hypothetical protein
MGMLGLWTCALHLLPEELSRRREWIFRCSPSKMQDGKDAMTRHQRF